MTDCETCRRRSWALRHADEYDIDEQWVVDTYGRTHDDERGTA